MSLEKELVEAFRDRLEALGWLIEGDASLRSAIVEFKEACGLRKRPFVGPITLGMLFDDEAPRRLEPLSAGEPPWMIKARSVMGLHETRDYTELSEWLLSDGATLGDPRKLPWCGDFVQTAVRRTLPDEAIPDNPYLARNWLKFGKETTPRIGAVLVFWRGSRSGISGHVGFYVGEDASAYHVLGGNQSNAVTVTRIAKSRLLGARWPLADETKTHTQHLAATGDVSTNEA